MCNGDVTSSNDRIIIVPPSATKPPPQPNVPKKNMEYCRSCPNFCTFMVYFSCFIYMLIIWLLTLYVDNEPEWEDLIPVESLSPAASTAATWDIRFSVADTKHINPTMEATLFHGDVAVSDTATLNASTSTVSAAFYISDTTSLEDSHIKPCLAVTRLRVRLEVEERVRVAKTSWRFVIVCENVVVVLSNNGNGSSTSCSSSSPPGLMGRSPCRGLDGSELVSDMGVILVVLTWVFLLVWFPCSLFLVKRHIEMKRANNIDSTPDTLCELLNA